MSALYHGIGEWVSGQRICDALGCSRAAVWNVVQGLKADGYRIEASPKRGYRLRFVPDALEPLFIKQLLGTRLMGRELVYQTSMPSTNQKARVLAEFGAPHGTLVLCDEQTAGVGRLGSQWVCAKGMGLLFSLILRPELSMQDTQKLTMMAALAMAQTLQAEADITPGIKWPNDIIIDGKKVCGILTHLHALGDNVSDIVLGVGLNVNQTAADIPADLAHKATSLRIATGSEHSRTPLLVGFCDRFEVLYDTYLATRDFGAVIAAYRPYSVTLARDVRIIRPGSEIEGTALYFDDDGMLVILRRDGVRERVLAGEVHVRGIMGEYDA